MGIEIKNARIKDAWIGDSDHGSLSSFLHLDFGGTSQGFGGYALYTPKFQHDNGGRWIWRCMQVVGVDEWSKLAGKPVRARIENGLIVAIGNFVEDRWFEPRVEFA